VKRLTVFIVIIAFSVGIAVGQVKNVAVVETEIDAQSGAFAELNPAEVRQVTAELRRAAVRNMPRNKYNIMTSETVQAQGGAVLEECADENCVIVLGSKIGADYIVRGTLSKLQTRFTLTVEMYETENGNLVASSDPVRSENIGELVEKAGVACADMYKTFVSSQGHAAKSSAQTPAKTPAQAALNSPEQNAPVTYTVTAAANPPEGGALSRNPNRANYAPGTLVNIMATPADGYKFTGWMGDAAGTANLLTLTMDDNKTLTANFQYITKTYTLTANVSPQGGGTVTRNPNKEAYVGGETVTLTATPENGYMFTDWAGAATGKKNHLKLTMDGDKALTANFSKKLELEPKPKSATAPPKPDAGVVQDPPAKKRHKLAAVGLDVIGTGILVFGYTKDMDVANLVDRKLYEDAEVPQGQRNIAYAIGTVILLSGISVHIFF